MKETEPIRHVHDSNASRFAPQDAREQLLSQFPVQQQTFPPVDRAGNLPKYDLYRGAILLNPGTATRAGEGAFLRPALEAMFETVLDLPEGHADGGDMLAMEGVITVTRPYLPIIVPFGSSGFTLGELLASAGLHVRLPLRIAH